MIECCEDCSERQNFTMMLLIGQDFLGVGNEPSIGCPKAITQRYPGIDNSVSACDDPMIVTCGRQHIELAVTGL